MIFKILLFIRLMSKRLGKTKNIKEESDDEISEGINETEDNLLEDDDNEYNESEVDDDFDDEDAEDECILEKMIDDDNDFFDNYQDSDIQINNNQSKLLKKEERISFNRLTKYEMVRILGERTKQLIMSAKPLIKNYESLSYEQIAEEELKLNMIPFKIKRGLPSGHYEIWDLEELDKKYLMSLLD